MRCPACNIALAGCAGDGAVAHSGESPFARAHAALDRHARCRSSSFGENSPFSASVFARSISARRRFSTGRAGASLLFIGVLQRGRARAALVQSPAGIRLLHTGDVFEGLKVRRIDDAALFLSDGAAVQRTLALGAPDSARQKSPQPTLGTKP